MGGVTRDRVALDAPGTRSLTGFPGWRMTTSRAVKRVHRTANWPWWFSSSGRGRFDLMAPRGTCYVACDERTAVRETVGETLASLGVIAHAFAAERVLSTLHLPDSRELADTCAETGVADWAVDSHPEPLAAAAQRCGIAVQPIPRSVRIIDPPDGTGHSSRR